MIITSVIFRVSRGSKVWISLIFLIARFRENMLTRTPAPPPALRGPINHESIVIKYEPPSPITIAAAAASSKCGFNVTTRGSSRDSDTGSTDSGRPPSLTETKSPRPTSLSSVSSGSSRASYLSDSLRVQMGSLVEEELTLTKVDHIIDELIHTEMSYIVDMGDLIRVSSLWIPVSVVIFQPIALIYRHTRRSPLVNTYNNNVCQIVI